MGEIGLNLPLRMRVLQCPGINRGWERDGGWKDTATGAEGELWGREQRGPCSPFWGPSYGCPYGLFPPSSGRGVYVPTYGASRDVVP